MLFAFHDLLWFADVRKHNSAHISFLFWSPPAVPLQPSNTIFSRVKHQGNCHCWFTVSYDYFPLCYAPFSGPLQPLHYVNTFLLTVFFSLSDLIFHLSSKINFFTSTSIPVYVVLQYIMVHCAVCPLCLLFLIFTLIFIFI